MRLLRLSKEIARAATLGENCNLHIGWASGPGYRGGPENYFSLQIEADTHNYVLEFDLEEAKRIQAQLDDFLKHIEAGKPWWETGSYFRIMRKKGEQVKS